MRLIARVVAVLLLGAGALMWQFERPPVSIITLNTLKPGASRQEIRAALGAPKNSYDNDRKWAYSRLLGWSIVYIYFTSDGRFEKYVYDK